MAPDWGRKLRPPIQSGAEAEAGEGVGDVVFAAADPDFEQRGRIRFGHAAGGRGGSCLAEGNQVELARFCVFDLEHERPLESC